MADPLHGANGDSTLPEGNGYGTATVSRGGMVSFAGSLADGTKISRSVPLSQGGRWPLYVGLYNGQGSILGWMTFTNAANVGGELAWTKPQTKARIYSSGFAWMTEANGMRYSPPGRESNVFGETSSSVVLALEGGDLAQGITNALTLNAANQVTKASLANKLTLSLTPSSGLFSGNQFIPGTRKAVSFNGVILQGQTNGAGYFLGTDQSGRVLLRQ